MRLNSRIGTTLGESLCPRTTTEDSVMRLTIVLMCAVCCAVAATGCRTVPPEWPTLDVTDPPDGGVQPPAWYKPAATPDPWPLGAEP